MQADMKEVNNQEEKLQREIMKLHLNNIGKHQQVINKNKINTNIKTTEELVRKMLNAPDDHKAGFRRPQLHAPVIRGVE